ncbi:hypothetical protein B0T26DRAFT_492469 [Lasiosphaeria miniovina]|uniref:Secreted protein n=1 Tax=Lasiosphaeria miniovina TaxID=1954250 RepID=A0AA40DKJ8_9PEZI|nr:uncharacterized protein B0T26DRAFT_492469 [Lasiosphaeria miniovina]KAK0703218.1 hypothetical protein B0T26DRAFT_492469 [Lasiosphaeria miniovina]
MATLFILAAGLARLERMATTKDTPSSVEQRRRTSWRKRLQQGLQSHPFSRKTAKTGSFFARTSGPWPLHRLSLSGGNGFCQLRYADLPLQGFFIKPSLVRVFYQRALE